ncbi:YetF domain-containing protein [Pseudalkalibacillus sp. A8]|uniref:YetF domain-containing protein n=1 Tax=Pseudalkalibacillus sp. A8 TaxID=3382641 RepID=UPI0038B650F7
MVKKHTGLAYPLIVDGKVHKDVLAELNLTDDWLKMQLRGLGVLNSDEVFFASIDSKTNLHVSLKKENSASLPPIHH